MPHPVRREPRQALRPASERAGQEYLARRGMGGEPSTGTAARRSSGMAVREPHEAPGIYASTTTPSEASPGYYLLSLRRTLGTDVFAQLVGPRHQRARRRHRAAHHA